MPSASSTFATMESFSYEPIITEKHQQNHGPKVCGVTITPVQSAESTWPYSNKYKCTFPLNTTFIVKLLT